jgi:hypothetical protein
MARLGPAGYDVSALKILPPFSFGDFGNLQSVSSAFISGKVLALPKSAIIRVDPR